MSCRSTRLSLGINEHKILIHPVIIVEVVGPLEPLGLLLVLEILELFRKAAKGCAVTVLSSLVLRLGG